MMDPNAALENLLWACLGVADTEEQRRMDALDAIEALEFWFSSKESFFPDAKRVVEKLVGDGFIAG